jgi:DNA polymerase III sliding clamp (beta) subunit (PCNA family)
MGSKADARAAVTVACKTKALQRALKAIPEPPARSELLGTTLVAEEGRLICRGTDHRVWVEMDVPATVSGSATFVAHSKAAQAMVESLGQPELALSIRADARTIGLVSGGFAGAIRHAASDPQQPIERGQTAVTIQASLLRRAFTAVRRSVDRDMSSKSGGLVLAAADGQLEVVGLTPYRLAIARSRDDWPGSLGQTRISPFVVDWICAQAPDADEPVGISTSESSVTCAGPGWLVSGPLIAAPPPPYHRIISAILTGVECRLVDGELLTAAVRRAASVAESVVLASVSGGLAVQAEHPERGESREIVCVSGAVQEWQTRLTARDLRDAIDALVDGAIEIGFNAATNGLILRTPFLTQIIMGKRV